MFPLENEYKSLLPKMHTAIQISTKRPALYCEREKYFMFLVFLDYRLRYT